MNRRKFLELIGMAGGVAAAAPLLPGWDLDKLLWVPSERKIFVPPVFAADDIEILARMAARELFNNLHNPLFRYQKLRSGPVLGNHSYVTFIMPEYYSREQIRASVVVPAMRRLALMLEHQRCVSPRGQLPPFSSMKSYGSNTSEGRFGDVIVRVARQFEIGTGHLITRIDTLVA